MTAIYDTLAKGGIMMIPLLLTSIIGLAVFIERAFYLRRKNILHPDDILLLRSSRSVKDVEEFLTRAKLNDGPLSNIVRVALSGKNKSREVLKEAIADQGRYETRNMERALVILETIAGIAPLMGLLGTVLGMIKVFQVISMEGLGQTQHLAGGISEALITTVVGLIIAIPSLVAYNFFTHRVEDLVLDIEKYSAEVVEKLHDHN